MSTTTPHVEQTVKVWDLLIRVFHWSLVSFFLLSYFTGDHGDSLHHWSGYTITGLLVFRLVWGFIGPTHAQFIDFVRSPSAIKQYLLSLRNGTAKRYIGHNPAGGAMVIMMLLGLSFMAFSGMLLAGFDGDGPLVNSVLLSLDFLPIKDLHELTANLLMAAIVFHVSGVILSSRLHRENLPKSMITGHKVVKE